VRVGRDLGTTKEGVRARRREIEGERGEKRVEERGSVKVEEGER
jgi:hypothetical protein